MAQRLPRAAWRARALGVLCVMSVLSASLLLGCSRSKPLPVLAQIPTFQLTASDGTTFDSASLAGTPYVVSFFFTHCPSVCPKLMAAMAEVRDALPAEVHLVSITVDPDNDTPERLTLYGASLGADPSRWHLLTGTRDELLKVVRGGFMTHMGEREEREPGLFDIAHGSRLMLVDGKSRLRAIVDPEFEEHKQLKSMVESVRSETP